MQTKMLPTPAKFHYVFNMRDLSRVFQGVLAVPHDSINTGGTRMAEGTYTVARPSTLVNVWKHECERVFNDKLTNYKDKDWYLKFVNETIDRALRRSAGWWHSRRGITHGQFSEGRYL